MGVTFDFLKYSFASIDIENYISNFNSERLDKTQALLGEGLGGNLTLSKTNVEQALIRSDVDTKGDFYTLAFLENVNLKLLSEEELDKQEHFVLDKLQKKFEVFKRVYDQYDTNIRKVSDDYEDINIYALLSVSLWLRFSKQKNYNDANSGLKLNDLLLFSCLPMDDRSKSFIYLALLLEWNSFN